MTTEQQPRKSRRLSRADGAREEEWRFQHLPDLQRIVGSRQPPSGAVDDGPGDGSHDAFVEYEPTGWGTARVFETFVAPSFRGSGVAEKMCVAAFDIFRESGLRIVPTCTYLVERFLPRNPRFATLALVSPKEPVATIAPPERDPPLAWKFDLGKPTEGQVHLMPFLLATQYCDADHPSVVQLARELIPKGCGALEAACRVRNWVRANILYLLDSKNRLASATLASREGMCTNKANLQIALLRAAGIPAGYILCHISKEAFGRDLVPELMEKISDPTLHCFCATMDSNTNEVFHFDATEELLGPPSANILLEESLETGETRMRSNWLRGPWTPIQANLDHLLAFEFPSKHSTEILERQNELYRRSSKI